MDGMHRVAGGDLEYRLPVRRDDELGDLATSFNKMTAEVGGGTSQDRRAGAAQDGGTGARPQTLCCIPEKNGVRRHKLAATGGSRDSTTRCSAS